MTPKEKAEFLVHKMYNVDVADDDDGDDDPLMQYHHAKKCAFIAVDEIIMAIDWHQFEVPNKEFDYWLEVKSEIEKK